MTEFKFKITQSSGYSYEYTVRANEKLDAFAKIKDIYAQTQPLDEPKWKKDLQLNYLRK